MIFSKKVSTTALFALAVYAVYKTSKHQVIASGLTAKSVYDDATTYISKTYKKHYKKL